MHPEVKQFATAGNLKASHNVEVESGMLEPRRLIGPPLVSICVWNPRVLLRVISVPCFDSPSRRLPTQRKRDVLVEFLSLSALELTSSSL